MTALIRIENLHYKPASLAPNSTGILSGIEIEISEGSFTAIVGENGSGKTTLLKQICGLLLPSSGCVLVDGLDTRLPDDRTKLRSMVGMVFQDPADQIVASTVEEDVAFGLENINLPTGDIRNRVAEQLSAAGLLGEATRPPHLLSGGQIQMVVLAGVLARSPRLILFDEPTSMLDPLARESFLKRIFKLRHEGMTIIYVTHHMDEVVNADQILVMHAGQIALSGSPQDVFCNCHKLYEYGLEIPEAMRFSENFQSLGWFNEHPIISTQLLLNALPDFSGEVHKITPINVESVHRKSKEPLIHLNNVHYTYLSGTPLARPALRGADIRVNQASFHAIAGANGSGKSTLLQHINGILRPEMGSVHVGDFILDDLKTPLRDVIRKAGLVFQNPESQFFEILVGDEIAYGPKQLGMHDIRNRVCKAMEMVGLAFDLFKDRRLDSLSGGEKRKVALASTLVLDQDILMLDEPTAGMDPRSRDEIMRLFQTLQDQGKTMLIASHRMEELAEMAEELSLMQSGQVLITGPCGEVMTNQSMVTEAGLFPPLAVRISQTLANKGWPIHAKTTYTPDRLFSAIKEFYP